MSRENRIVWTEGMFLGPQHFQQSDRFRAGELRFLQETFEPYAWGVRLADFDLEDLGNSSLKREKC